MKFSWFHLMPYRWLPPDFRERYHGVWVDVPNRLYDPERGHELYNEYLTFRGFGVITAPDGEAGLALALTMKPDVVVMDLAMPGLNGITATHRLKQHPRTRRIPVVVLTGYAFRAIQQGALEAGADIFLTKPCLPEDLERAVRDLLARGRR